MYLIGYDSPNYLLAELSKILFNVANIPFRGFRSPDSHPHIVVALTLRIFPKRL